MSLEGAIERIRGLAATAEMKRMRCKIEGAKSGGFHLDSDGFRLALLIAAVLLFIVLVTDMLTSG